MSTLRIEPNEYTNISTSLSMTPGKTYRFNNSGYIPIMIIFSETQPAAGDIGAIYDKYKPDNDETLVYDGTIEIWAKAISHPGSYISVSLTDSRVALKPDPRSVLILPFHTTSNQTTLSAPSVIGSRDITVVDPTGFTVGKYVLLFSILTNRFYKGYVTAAVGPLITLDSPLDSVLPIGANADTGSTNMNVNGAVTPVVFGVRSPTPGIPSTADVYRLMIQMTLNTAPDFGKFGDIAVLLNGIILRFTNGVTTNIFNVKKNSEFSLLSGDYVPYDAANPGIGVFGIGVRLTFSGQEKMGTVIRVGPGEDLEIVIQDNLSGLLSFEALIEGNIFNP